MPNNQTDLLFNSLICIFAIIIILTVLGALSLFLTDFLRELRYLNKEIQCTAGEEREYWIRQRRRLWLSLLPFIKY